MRLEQQTDLSGGVPLIVTHSLLAQSFAHFLRSVCSAIL